MSRDSTPLVIGIGNSFRGDDAIGQCIAEEIKKKSKIDVDILLSEGDGMDLINQWETREIVYVIDAVESMGDPGTIHIIDLSHRQLAKDLRSASTHQFDLVKAIALSKTTDRLPLRMIICAIEAEQLGWVEGVTARVSQAGTKLAEHILQELDADRERSEECSDP